jgi:hypothetical protein
MPTRTELLRYGWLDHEPWVLAGVLDGVSGQFFSEPQIDALITEWLFSPEAHEAPEGVADRPRAVWVKPSDRLPGDVPTWTGAGWEALPGGSTGGGSVSSRTVVGGNLGTAAQVNLAGYGDVQFTGTLNADCTLTIVGLPTGPSRLLLLLQQDSVGGRLLTISFGGGSQQVQIPNGANDSMIVQVASPDGSDLYVQGPSPGTTIVGGGGGGGGGSGVTIAAGNLGTTHTLALASLTEVTLVGVLTANVVITVTGIAPGAHVWMALQQDSTGGRTVTRGRCRVTPRSATAGGRRRRRPSGVIQSVQVAAETGPDGRAIIMDFETMAGGTLFTTPAHRPQIPIRVHGPAEVVADRPDVTTFPIGTQFRPVIAQVGIQPGSVAPTVAGRSTEATTTARRRAVVVPSTGIQVGDLMVASIKSTSVGPGHVPTGWTLISANGATVTAFWIRALLEAVCGRDDPVDVGFHDAGSQSFSNTSLVWVSQR